MIYRIILFFTITFFLPNTSKSQELAWRLKVDRSTDTKHYQRHDISTQNNQLVLDFSEFARNRTPLKIELSEDATPNASFSFFTLIKSSKESVQNSVIASNKHTETTDGWEIRTNELGGWEWNYTSNNKVIAEYKTTSKKYIINDDEFHLLGFSYDYRKNQVWIYFDGEHIGILNIKKANLSEFKTIYLGGIGENEKTSFDGYFKYAYLFKDLMKLGSVKRLYNNNPKYKGNIGDNGHFYDKVRVLTWNITDGGTYHGDVIGMKRTLKILKDSKADIISLQEVRGSLEYLASGLGYYFYSINEDLAILSRFPIKRTLKIFDTEKLGAVEIIISNKQSLYYFNTMLSNDADWSDFSNRYTDEEFRNKEHASRVTDVAEILKQIDLILKPSKRTAIVLTGELNSLSAEDENGQFLDYPVSNLLREHNFIDSYREYYPNSRIYNGYTRNINSKEKKKGRIDYIYFKGKKLQVNSSKVIKKHPIRFPSNNNGVLTEFIWKN